MLIDDLGIQNMLWRLVQAITTDWTAHQDLMQEALLHLWQRERRCSGQSLSWYLQSCHWHLLNCLQQGRSVDSLKRGRVRWSNPEASDAENDSGDSGGECDESLLPSVCARDLLEQLSTRMSPDERETLLCLADGFQVREIARKLNVSHQAVSKRRQKIAEIAVQLGFRPRSRRESVLK